MRGLFQTSPFKSLFCKWLVSWSLCSWSSRSCLLLTLVSFLLGNPLIDEKKSRGVSGNLPHLRSEGSALSSCSQTSSGDRLGRNPSDSSPLGLSLVKRALSLAPPLTKRQDCAGDTGLHTGPRSQLLSLSSFYWKQIPS